MTTERRVNTIHYRVPRLPYIDGPSAHIGRLSPNLLECIDAAFSRAARFLVFSLSSKASLSVLALASAFFRCFSSALRCLISSLPPPVFLQEMVVVGDWTDFDVTFLSSFSLFAPPPMKRVNDTALPRRCFVTGTVCGGVGEEPCELDERAGGRNEGDCDRLLRGGDMPLSFRFSRCGIRCLNVGMSR